MSSTEIETDLESLIEDDKIDHGVCPICFPKDEGTQIALCGKDVSDDIFIPFAECVNVCKECLKLDIPHQLNHLLGR